MLRFAALLLLIRPDSLVVGVLTDPVNLEPHKATDFATAAVVANVYETLVRFRPQVPYPEGVLATTWATSDGRVWTFTLREGVRFQDGTPFDADAVVTNVQDLERVRGFPGRASRLGPLAVSITLDRPNGALLATLSQPFFAIESPNRLSSGLPAGTGPFRFTTAKPGLIELERNSDYWGGSAPPLKTIIFKKFASQEALLTALLEGEVDETSALDGPSVARCKGRADIALEVQEGLNLAFLSLNNERAPYSDPRVRRALAHSLDTEGLVERVLGGRGQPTHMPLPPSIWGFTGRAKSPRLDPTGARRLLAEAGFPQGFDTTLLSVDSPRPYMPAPRVLAQQIQTDLATVGVRARIEEVSNWTEYVSRGSRGEYEMAVFGWQADTADPNDFLSSLLSTDSIGSTNRSRYRSAAMDLLLKRGQRETELTSRLATYREAQELFQRDLPFIPLFSVSVFTAYGRSVHGLVLGPTGVLRYDKTWKVE